MMRALDAMEVRDALIERIARGRAVSGICLGLAGAVRSAAKKRRKCAAWAFSRASCGAFRRCARAAHGLEPARAVRRSRDCCAGLTGARRIVYFAHSYYAPEWSSRPPHCTYDVALHGGARSRATSSACSSIRRNPARWVCAIVRNFVELRC